ncbi:hypothetical protein SAMN05444162_1244 [Paenibacillaceae bacterium GAS479]|nr:hypothetical protein SAMN05444162_1244 [Paenibacillaceae bacterium GAS479]
MSSKIPKVLLISFTVIVVTLLTLAYNDAI